MFSAFAVQGLDQETKGTFSREELAPLAGTRLSAIRDRALLLIGFAGAFRRSELVALNADDIEEKARDCASPSAAAKPTRRAMVTSLPFREG